IIADYIKVDQQKVMKRLMIAVPLFAVSIALTQIDFALLWRYFSWANQATAAVALWLATMYLYIQGKNYLASLAPAIFITYMVFVYILNQKIGFNLDLNLSFIIGLVFTIITVGLFFLKARKNRADDVETVVAVD